MPAHTSPVTNQPAVSCFTAMPTICVLAAACSGFTCGVASTAAAADASAAVTSTCGVAGALFKV